MSLDETGRIKLVQTVRLASGKTFQRRRPRQCEHGTWDDDKVALLKNLYREGLSCGQIATRIGTTRNAVIGKVHRLGLPLRGATTLRVTGSRNGKKNAARWRSLIAKRRSPAPVAAPRFSTEPLPPPHEIDIPRIKTADLEDHHCRWPCGDPREPDFGFCGKDKILGLPYCEPHARRAFAPPQARNRLPVPRPTPAIPLLEDA